MDRRKVPKNLIYEMVNSKPIYYRNYKKVLKGELTPEAVVGSGYVQWKLISIILQALFRSLDMNRYEIATNEAGFLLAPGTYRALDIAIFEKEKLKEYEEKNYAGYVKVPPEVIIEVDTKADLSNFENDTFSYVKEKVEDLLNAGVKKIIWFFTGSRQVLIAKKGERDWILSDWNKDVEIINGIVVNVSHLLDK